ncbi:hypothetical protein CYLTODRAFT_476428 [Cylindrobasidium torrendii FP15055 ss-10]|uniref:Uncharacterized protein n=1 Tax=Cylindrobasidium torrendii FP15055 ss-10 TaxID=1314674 RepID=A0A0D7AUQ9_9AGAR|nr:hypothetical protein CYLTODRAFT_476428 [Cylindrobasidium torrendii FP15055 ss-10]
MPTATVRVETYAPIFEFPEPLIVPLFATDIPRPAYHKLPIHRGFMREALRARRPHPYRQEPPLDLPHQHPPPPARTPADDPPLRALTPANNPPRALTPVNNPPPRPHTLANDPLPQTPAKDPPRPRTPANDPSNERPADVHDDQPREVRPPRSRRVRLASEEPPEQTVAAQPLATRSRPVLIPKPSKTPLKGLDATSLDRYRDEFALKHAETRFKAEFADLQKYENFWPIQEVLRDQLKSLKDTRAKAEKRK